MARVGDDRFLALVAGDRRARHLDPDLVGNLKLHGFNQDGSDPNVFYANAIEKGSSGLRPGFNEKIVTQDGGDFADMELDQIGGALNLKWTFANDMTFTSITGYDTVENFQK